MANNVNKILDIISKVATIQQLSNGQQSQSTHTESRKSYAAKRDRTSDNTNEQPNYIYISKEDLTSMFPGLADKLDITKLLSGLTSKAGISKLLSVLQSFGVQVVNPQEEPPKETEK